VYRRCFTDLVQESVLRVLSTGPSSVGFSLIYDVAHNIAKVEEHMLNGTKKKLIVHRKGATRAFPPGHPELPDTYRHTGQPVIIPGDMGRASFVLLGTETGMRESFGSTCHGAGRLMSRHQAIRRAKGRSIRQEMEDLGITVRWTGRGTLAEEMPEAYKDISNVVDVVHSAGLSKKVAKLRPLGVIKG
jgi:tRNA-splicing ligase RtcB